MSLQPVVPFRQNIGAPACTACEIPTQAHHRRVAIICNRFSNSNLDCFFTHLFVLLSCRHSLYRRESFLAHKITSRFICSIVNLAGYTKNNRKVVLYLRDP